jgi:apolipoprotein N-acyltransferase
MNEGQARSAGVWLWGGPLLSAGLLYLCYFPAALGGLAWLALIPLLALVRLPGGRLRYLACYLGGLALYVPVLQWARVADPRMYITWMVLSFYCAAYWVVWLGLVRLLERRTVLPLVLTAPLVWVSLEFFRWGMAGSFVTVLLGHPQHDIPGGFGWYLLGHTQHDFLPLLQLADLTGVYGISALVLAGNALLFEILQRQPIARSLLQLPASPTSRLALLGQAVVVGGLLLAALAYGNWRLGQSTGAVGPRLALLQSNLPQQVRNASFAQDGESSRRQVVRHVDDLIGATARLGVDLAVTPETCYPGTWVEIEPGKPIANSLDFLIDKTLEARSAVLLGLNSYVHDEQGQKRSYNSAILGSRAGEFLGRYDKVHRVPFGEYVPLRSWLPFLSYFAPYDYEYEVAPGREFVQFELPAGSQPATRFGVVICYEDTDPAMVRPHFWGRDRPIDFLLNISNEGWFDGTSEHEQHLAICRFRAVEVRRSVARAVNMGISALIDSNGRVLAPDQPRRLREVTVWPIPDDAEPLPVRDWHLYKKTPGIVVGRVAVDDRFSFYAQWGDVFAWMCGLTVLILLGVVGVRWRRTDASQPA